MMYERYTERARQVVVLAQDEARGLKHNYIGTEHLLLGLLREQEGLAARVLESLEIGVDDVRTYVRRAVGQGDEKVTGRIPFTPCAKKALELSLREALSLGHNYIGTEHILLGLVRKNEGVAMRYLDERGLGAAVIRQRVEELLRGPRFGTPGAAEQQAQSPLSRDEPSLGTLGTLFLRGVRRFGLELAKVAEEGLGER